MKYCNINKAIVDSGLRRKCAAHNEYFQSSLYRWEKFGRNLGCHACRVLSPLRNARDAP